MLIKANKDRVIAFVGYNKVILQSGFIAKVEKFFKQYNERFLKERLPLAKIHHVNLKLYQERWHVIKSNNTCFLCLRRRPQHKIHYGYEICENCVAIFGKRFINDPWVFEINECFLCGELMVLSSPEVQLKRECELKIEHIVLIIRIHPPTTSVGILCVNGGGIRATAPLGFMKRIKNHVDLPITFQRFFKLAIGVNSSKLLL